jgi:pimeloyl-ACP methyl ester carboxylesterase
VKVVLLHSALGDSRLWRRQVEALRPAHEVVTPDLPGWGTEPLPTEPFSFVDAVATHLPAALVGNSFGGAVALRTALAHPDKVLRLALVGSGLPAWDWTDELRDHFGREEAAFDTGDLDAATEVNMEFWVAPEHRDEVRPQQRRALELQTAHEEPDVIWPELAPIASLTMPVLVVVGDQDKGDFKAIAHHLADEIDGAELVVVPGAGHLVGVDRPDELNALLLDFLNVGTPGV